MNDCTGKVRVVDVVVVKLQVVEWDTAFYCFRHVRRSSSKLRKAELGSQKRPSC